MIKRKKDLAIALIYCADNGVKLSDVYKIKKRRGSGKPDGYNSLEEFKKKIDHCRYAYYDTRNQKWYSSAQAIFNTNLGKQRIPSNHPYIHIYDCEPVYKYKDIVGTKDEIIKKTKMNPRTFTSYIYTMYVYRVDMIMTRIYK